MTVARQQYVSSACRRLQSSMKGNEAACAHDTLEGDVPFAFVAEGAKSCRLFSHLARRDWCLSKIGQRQRG